MKKLLFAIPMILLFCEKSFCQNGSVLVIDKIAPKNAAFVGVVDASQTVVNSANFSKNLVGISTNAQSVFDAIDQFALGGGVGTISTITAGVGISVLNGTGPVVTISATGGGSSGATVYGALYLSSSPTLNFLTGNQAQDALFPTNFFSTHNFTSQGVAPFQDLLLVTTPTVIDVYAYIYSTGPASTAGRRFWLGINGSTDASGAFTCFDYNSIRCSMEGIFSVSAGSTLTIMQANIGVGPAITTTMTVIDAGLIVKSIGSGTSGGGGGAGTITSVNAGNGLLGGGASGAVTLALDPAATDYIQNNPTATPQSALINIYTAGGMQFIVDTLNSVVYLNDTTGTGSTNMIFEVGGNAIGSLVASSVPGSLNFYVSTVTGSGNLINRMQINDRNETTTFIGRHTFDSQTGTRMAEFDPILNTSSFTAVVVKSTLTVVNSYLSINGTTYNWQAGIGSSGQCLQTDGSSPIPTLTWGSCSGGATSFVLLEDGTDFLLEDGTKLLTE